MKRAKLCVSLARQLRPPAIVLALDTEKQKKEEDLNPIPSIAYHVPSVQLEHFPRMEYVLRA